MLAWRHLKEAASRTGSWRLLSACTFNRINPWGYICLEAKGPGGQAYLACHLAFSLWECCEHCKICFESAFTNGNRIRHEGEHDAETSEAVNYNSVQCKHRWTASRRVVGHLCAAANDQAWSLTAQESLHHGEGSLQRHVQQLNWRATGWRSVSEGKEQ